MPKKIPITEIAVKEVSSSQSICNCHRSPVNPIRDLIAMIIKEVATAFFIGNLAKRTKAGIIKKPPPAPTNPVNIPIINPSIVKSGILYLICVCSLLYHKKGSYKHYKSKKQHYCYILS